jgi:hypothetical protein
MFVRLATIATGAVAALALSVAPASAHFCYNAHAFEKGMEGMSGSEAFMSFGELAFMFTELCPAGIDILADAAGVETYTAINVRTVMASGSGGKSQGIKHLDFEAIEAAMPDAFAACAE